MTETIRHATEADYPAVNEILEQDSAFHAELEPDWMTDTSGISLAEFSEYISDSNKEMLLCERDGLTLGIIQLSVGVVGDPGMKFQPFGSIDEIAVAEKYRGTGIGNALMMAAESWAKENSLKMLRLDVWSKNDPAIGLYEKHDFKKIRYRMYREISEGDT